MIANTQPQVMIGFLADFPDVIPVLVKWFRNQWPDYYADMTQAQMEQGFHAESLRDRTPTRLVALESGELVGTIVLRKFAIDTLPEFQPGLGGLFVSESRRGKGIGTQLVQAGMNLALDQGYEAVYATTTAAAGILERLGWAFITTVVHRGEELKLYRFKR